MTGENTLWLTGERLSAIHIYETLCQLILGSLGLCCPFTAGVQVGSKAFIHSHLLLLTIHFHGQDLRVYWPKELEPLCVG
jgi:hypothetical protein